VWREAQVLGVLGERGLLVPRVVASGADPAFVATELVGGEGLAYDWVAGAAPAQVEAIADQLAGFLAALHAPETLASARQRVDDLERPLDVGIELTTGQLRAALPAMVTSQQRPVVARWCDWIDAQEAVVAVENVLVHGDYHPFNQLWDLAWPRLLAVVDYETSHLASPEFDFRVLPVFGPGVDVLLATVHRYESLTGRALKLERIAASHLHDMLATAAWRTEAGLPLPPPGETPAECVDEVAARLAALGIGV
jgi:aminoglycoside phosphotransferase (APT) family kinase protein